MKLTKEDAQKLVQESQTYAKGHSAGFTAGFQSALETVLLNQEKGDLNDKGKTAVDTHKSVAETSKK